MDKHSSAILIEPVQKQINKSKRIKRESSDILQRKYYRIERSL